MTGNKGNRHFSGKRFYKIIKILVITLSVLLWLGALLLMQYAYNWKNNQMDVEIASCAQDIPKPDSTHYAYCTNFYNSVATNQITEVYFLATFGTLLPIIFFGGVALIRYLFPVTPSVFDDPLEIDDLLYEQAKKVTSEYDHVSAALIQRHLGTGYARACRLLDQLAEEDIVEKAYNKSKPRKVLKR